ncbi:MAG: HEAT repeat domain-containing protein, partial [Polyangiaceae bacterium]
DVTQQRIAIDVLAYVHNRNAALPLFAFATGSADEALRTRAMISCGVLSDVALVPKVDALLFPKNAADAAPGGGDAVSEAAVWGLARMADARAFPVLMRVARSGTPATRALAILGLGMGGDRAASAAIAGIARSADAGSVVRAAVAYALGDLNAPAQVPLLLEMAHDSDALPRRSALLALAKIDARAGDAPAWEGEATRAMADAVFAGSDGGPRGEATAHAVAGTAVAALAAVAARMVKTASLGADRDVIPAPDGPLDVESLMEALMSRDATPEGAKAALVYFAAPIERAALSALRTSTEGASAVLEALGSGRGELLPFVDYGEPRGSATEAARAIGAALEGSVVPLARNPDAAVRAKAIVLLAQSSDDAALSAVIAGLTDPSAMIQRLALSAIAAPRHAGEPVAASAGLVAAVGQILAGKDPWSIRVLAARALGQLGLARPTEARGWLATAATGDAYAFVREAALDALASFDAAGARTVARTLAGSDPEPRVRAAAVALER